jgi:hypothetical protein
MSRNYHDYGGQPAGPVDPIAHDPTFWERRLDAISQLLGDPRRRILRVDELRWMRETMDSQEYERLSYYEKWVSSLARILIKKNVISEDELAAAMTEIRGRESPVS